MDEPKETVASIAVAQNGFVFLSPAAASGILVQPSRAATECEVDRARQRAASCRRVQTSDTRVLEIMDVALTSLAPSSSCEVS